MKRIGIFTKMEMAGGSEFRALEMATAISRIPGYQGVLMAERSIAAPLRGLIPEALEVHEEIMEGPNHGPLYSVDHLLVINSDSRVFTSLDYWRGKGKPHGFAVNLPRIRKMTFLFNFKLAPADQLPDLKSRVPHLRIITANSKFFREIDELDRYELIRKFPRLQLESPVDPAKVKPKTASARLRFGMHSLPAARKWNSQLPEAIKMLNDRHGDRISWDFMGMPEPLAAEIHEANVRIRREFSLPVPDFLSGVDVFLFFLNWTKEEAWARSAAEALMSGCPVITTANGGNIDQVMHGETGYLCRTLEEIVESCSRLVNEPDTLAAMRIAANRFAQRFTSDAVAARCLNFLQ